MEVKTRPQYWFQMEPRPTDELTRIWETGEVGEKPDLDLDLVEQILVARHVLEPTRHYDALPLVGFKPKPPVDYFTINQKIGTRMTRRWEVALTEDQAEFRSRDGSEHFVIGRENARAEFQFKRTGLLWLFEDHVALVRGKNFDFAAQKPLLSAWLQPFAMADLRKELVVWGIGMVLMGSLSLLLGTPLGPVLGSVLILVGALNFVAHHRGWLAVDGVTLIGNGVLLLSTALSALSHSTMGPDVPAFWALLGAFQVVLGFQSFQKMSDYKELTRDQV